MKKFLTYTVAVIVVFFGYLAYDWYDFAANGELSTTQGAFGNPKLEIWIDINARMPAPARAWACKTLLDRQTAVMGRSGPVPYSCDPQFGVDNGMTSLDYYIEQYANGAARAAQNKGATEEQLKQIAACATEAMNAALPQETKDNLNSAPTSESTVALNTAAREAQVSCLAQVMP